MIGRTLGSYRIVEKIGAGGMGEVYRARDLRLDRDVAVKVLPSAFANDPERIQRFEREARLLASLNHPNIAHVHGFEESGGTRFLVLELVEGETLAQHLRAGALPVEEALPVAKQIAEALEYAHEHGILHRDLKPANIKLTPEGKVKVLDFGLAKAFTSDSSGVDLSGSPTISEVATRAGIMLGTAAYMSPEQARGKPVDKRTDIWAFGCVLYEALTGRQAFPGETVTDSLAVILKAEPDWNALPANTPAHIQSLLRRCLQKDPGRRLRDIGDARIEMDEALSPPAAAADAATTGRGTSRRSIALWCTGGILVGALATGAILWPHASPETRPAMRFNVVTNLAGVETSPSLSPDARSVALVSNRDGQYDIYVALVAGGILVRITNDPHVEARPRWSPDGTRIVYGRLNESGLWDIWIVHALGGTPRRILTNGADPAWSPDGATLAYADLVTDAIWLCDANGSNPRALTREERPSTFRQGQPAFSRDGRQVAFVRKTRGPRSELWVAEVATGRAEILTPRSSLVLSPVWSPDNRYIYYASSRGGTINIWKMAARGGEPEQITAGQGDDAELDLSADGKRLVFSAYRQNKNLARVEVDAAGSRRELTWLTTDSARGESAPAVSPDGRRVAYFANRKGAERESIWVMDADGSNPIQVVADERLNIFPRWGPDGESLFYASRAPEFSDAEIRRVWLAGGQPEKLPLATLGHQWGDVSADGRLVFRPLSGPVPLFDVKTKQTQMLKDLGGDYLLRWSRDGRYLAYVVVPQPHKESEAGLWVYDFRQKPRQLFRGWVVAYAWAGGELFVLEGKPDLKGVLWRVRLDAPPVRTSVSLRFENQSIFSQPQYFDVFPDRRRLVAEAMELDEADIVVIENVR